MATKPSTRKGTPSVEASAPSSASSHQIWLAGLGAMAQAQEQGSKAFQSLVNDGLAFQQKSQMEAQQRFQEASERFSSMAQNFGQQATGRIDRLEHVFEERVAKALHRLGMPSLEDLMSLQTRVEALEARLQSLSADAGAKPARTAPARKKTGSKS